MLRANSCHGQLRVPGPSPDQQCRGPRAAGRLIRIGRRVRNQAGTSGSAPPPPRADSAGTAIAARASTQRIGTSDLRTAASDVRHLGIQRSDAGGPWPTDSQASSAPCTARSASTVAGTSSTWTNPFSAGSAPRQSRVQRVTGIGISRRVRSTEPTGQFLRGAWSNRRAGSFRRPPGRPEQSKPVATQGSDQTVRPGPAVG